MSAFATCRLNRVVDTEEISTFAEILIDTEEIFRRMGYMHIPDEQKLWVGNLSKHLYGPELMRWLNLKGFETPIPLKVVPE